MKLVLVGEHGVGKTSITQRRILERAHRAADSSSSLSEQHHTPPTVGVDFACKAIEIDRDPWPCRVHVWDTSGQERFRPLVHSHLRDLDAGDAVVVVYNVTDAKSFEAVDHWVQKVQELARGSPQIAILGTNIGKLDKGLEGGREVPTAEGQRKADEVGAVLFLETCAATDEVSSNSEQEQRLFKVCFESLLRKCRAATPPEVSLGASMPRTIQDGQGLEGGTRMKANDKYQYLHKRGIAHCFCKCPWRTAFQCFGFA